MKAKTKKILKKKTKKSVKPKIKKLSPDDKMTIASMHAALVFGPTYYFKK